MFSVTNHHTYDWNIIVFTEIHNKSQIVSHERKLKAFFDDKLSSKGHLVCSTPYRAHRGAPVSLWSCGPPTSLHLCPARVEASTTDVGVRLEAYGHVVPSTGHLQWTGCGGAEFS